MYMGRFIWCYSQEGIITHTDRNFKDVAPRLQTLRTNHLMSTSVDSVQINSSFTLYQVLGCHRHKSFMHFFPPRQKILFEIFYCYLLILKSPIILKSQQSKALERLVWSVYDKSLSFLSIPFPLYQSQNKCCLSPKREAAAEGRTGGRRSWHFICDCRDLREVIIGAVSANPEKINSFNQFHF